MSSSIYGAIGILLPLSAYFIVNQDWRFYIPVIDIVFKPWRSFVLFCGLPSLISVLCLIWLPESPKFLYSIGNDEKALHILKQIHKINTGHEHYHVTKIIDAEFGITSKKSWSDYLSQMWNQTRILFGKKYLRVTIITCFMQFGASSFIAGMLVFFPKILHDIATFVELQPDGMLTVCGIEHFLNDLILNTTEHVEVSIHCIDKMDITSFMYPVITESLYMVGFFVIGLLVNYVGIWLLSSECILIGKSSCISILF